jgi:hypothetical protein
LTRRQKQNSIRFKLANILSFIDACGNCIGIERWNRYYPEIEQSAGETLHIVKDLVHLLAANQIPIELKLRKSSDTGDP